MKAMGKPKKSNAWLGAPTSLEIYYIYSFLLSIALGIVYGLFDKTWYYTAVARFPRSESPLGIFVHNISIDLLSVVTGGIFGLFSNFLTFSVISALFGALHVGFLRVIVVTGLVFGSYGLLEIAGHLCFGLVGFTYLERLVWKKETQLHRDHLFMLGAALIIVAASLEWLLSILTHRLPG